MKIIWLTNIKVPIISKYKREQEEAYGGWIAQFAERIVEKNKVAFVYPGKRINKSFDNREVIAYEFVSGAQNTVGFFVDIIKEFNPDVIHVWGTEYVHSREMMDACELMGCLEKVVISIQGLVSIYAIHYYADVPVEIIKKQTLRDLIRNQSIRIGRKNFGKQGLDEVKAIKKAKNVIGRTTWDRVCTQLINPDVRYFKCNETLRQSFYDNTWDVEKCSKRSIVLSQGHYPIKGLHILIEALRLLRVEYDDVRLYVAGNDIVNCDITHKSYYGAYIKKLIKRYELTENVIFVGVLNEDKMRELMISSNVFVNCSSIENSSNSIGEAMLLGMPAVCSNVGGTPDFVKHGETGFLYPYDEYYLLYYYIKQLFENDLLARDIGKAAHMFATKVFDIDTNYNTLQKIYLSVLEERD